MMMMMTMMMMLRMMMMTMMMMLRMMMIIIMLGMMMIMVMTMMMTMMLMMMMMMMTLPFNIWPLAFLRERRNKGQHNCDVYHVNPISKLIHNPITAACELSEGIQRSTEILPFRAQKQPSHSHGEEEPLVPDTGTAGYGNDGVAG